VRSHLALTVEAAQHCRANADSALAIAMCGPRIMRRWNWLELKPTLALLMARSWVCAPLAPTVLPQLNYAGDHWPRLSRIVDRNTAALLKEGSRVLIT
jgi:hypothetical protein